MNERISPQARAYFDERLRNYMKQGHDFGTAEEMADMDLLAWSQPLPLPNMDIAELYE